MMQATLPVQKWSRLGRIGQRFCYATIKPAARGSVHGVRASLPNALDYFSPFNKEGDFQQQAEEQLEEKKEQQSYAEDVSGASVEKHDVAGSNFKAVKNLRTEEIPPAKPLFLRSEEIPAPAKPIFQQTRHFATGGRVAKVAREEAEPFVERAREALEDVRRGVRSTEAGGVMTNVVRRIAYFQDPDEITYFQKVYMGTADEAFEEAQRMYEEARACGDGVNPATQLLRKYIDSQSALAV